MTEHRIGMYADYCTELDAYDPFEQVFPPDQAEMVARSYLIDSKFEWIPIFDGVKEVGFLITADDLPFFGAGKYICEAYVQPDHRLRGLMASAVREMLKKCSIVHLEVYPSNPAIQMWGKLLRSAGFSEITAEPSPLTEGTIHFAYKKEGP